MEMESSWAQRQWDTVLEAFGNDKFNIVVLGTFGTFMCVYWGIGALFAYVDLTGRPKFMAKYKIQENVKTYPLSIDAFLDLVKVVFFNHLLILPLLIGFYQLDKWWPLFQIRTLPSIFTVVSHLLFSILVIEILFYYCHRALHHPSIYKLIHKKHHTWTSPVAISALYCHPLEQIVSNLLPTAAGPFLLGSHILVYWIWFTIAVITTLVTHSGYHLPFLPSAEAHDFHHLKFNYNYGVVGLLDRLHGTDGLFRASKESVRHRTLWTLASAKQLFPS